MTARITPRQVTQFKRFVEDAGNRALKRVALDKDGLQRLIGRGGEFQDYIAAGISRFASKLPDYTLARLILGKDFIPPGEIATTRGVTYTDEQLAKFGDTLPTQEALGWCRDNGMMLVAGPPTAMSLFGILAINADFFYPKGFDWCLDKVQKFARDDKAEPAWIALRKDPVEDSFSKNWSEQQALVEGPMTIPNAAEAVWGLTTYKAVRNVYLLDELDVRTSSLDSSGASVVVGHFNFNGLYVSDYYRDGRFPILGVSASRKF